MNGTCPTGMVHRKSYTRKNGTHVKSACVPKPSRSRRCGPNEIIRAGYHRKLSSKVRASGYTRKIKNGRVIHVYPKINSNTYVPPACVKDIGKAGKLSAGVPRIGPLHQGDLKKYGYSYKLPEDVRRKALERAVGKYGALSTYRKLNAVAKLSGLSAPAAAAAFSADRNWIHGKFMNSKEKGSVA